MTVIFIPIYREKKSDKELLEEMERDARFRKAVEEDERRERERKEREKRQKEEEKEERRRKAEKEYYDARMKDPWDFSILPEGWSIFGQQNFNVITEINGICFQN